MKKINLFVFAVAISVQCFAQQFMYNGTTEIANTFPFAGTNNFRQSIYYPSDFPTAPAGNIVAIYLKASGAVSPNITNLKIKMGSTSMTIFPNSTYVGGLQTVYSGSYTQPSISGNYVKIPLQTPFAYNPNQNFIVELSQEGYTTGFQIMQGSVNVNSRTVFGAIANTSGTVQHRLATMGFDMEVSMSTAEINGKNDIHIYPNPVTDVLSFTKIPDDATYTFYNSAGRMVERGTVGNRGTVDVSALSPGIYTVSVVSKEETVLNTKFIKK